MNQRTRTGLKRLVALLMTVVMVMGLVTVPAAAIGDTTPTAPVQDNLVLWLDANNNTGKGTHDSSATKWVNLADPSQKIDVTAHSWGKDAENGAYYLTMKDGYIILPDEVRQAIGGTSFTVEFLLEDLDSTTGTAKTIMNTIGDDAWIEAGGATSVVNDNFVIFMNASGGNSDVFCFRTCYTNSSGGWTKTTNGSPDYAKVGNNSNLNGVTQTISFNADGQSIWYQDGEQAASATNTGKTVSMDGFKVDGTWQTERKPQVVFGAPNGLIGQRHFDANVKAIRIYNTALSATDAAANAAYDQSYYYHEHDWSEDWSYDDTHHWHVCEAANCPIGDAADMKGYAEHSYADDQDVACDCGYERTVAPTSAVPEGYSEEGLVLFLDGVDNTGTGYDADAAQWVNLANLKESVGTNGHSFSADGGYLAINNGYIKLPDTVRQAIASGTFTIEFLMDNYEGDPKHTSGGISNIMALTGSDRWIAATTTKGKTPNDNFVIYQYNGSSNVIFKVNSNPNEAGRVKISGENINGVTQALSFNAGAFTWYQDAESKGTAATYDATPSVSTFTGAQEGEVPQVIFGAATDTVSDRAFSGEVKAIRVYDRTLTAAELAAHAELDAERYAEEEPAQIEVPDGYVTDNLVMFLDANLNNGTGYDADATGWVDLTDATGETVVKTNGNTWGTSEYNTQYLTIDNNYILLPDKARQAIAGENFTVEFIMEDYTSSDTGNIINVMCVTGDDAWIKSMSDAGKKGGVVNDNFVLFVTQSSASTTETDIKFRTAWWNGGWDITVSGTGNYCRADGTLISDKTTTYTFDHDGCSYCYIDGVKATNGESQNLDGKTISLDGFKIDGTWQTERLPQVAFGAATDTISGRSFSGKVKAIRIYSDVLSAEEAAQNAARDNARYYTDPTADHTHEWETEWTQTATEHYYACAVDGCETKHGQGKHVYTNDDDASCNTCGYTRAIKSVVASYDVGIYEPVTDVNTAPIIMQMATEETKDVSGEAKRPSAVVYDLRVEENVLNAYEYEGSDKLGALADLYAANYGTVNIGVRVSDMDTAEALAAWAETERVGNLWVISNDVEQIKTVTDVMPTIRGVVDLTGDSVRGPGNIQFDFTGGDGTIDNANVGGDYAINAASYRKYDWITYTKGSKASVYENMDWADVYDLIFAEGYRTILIPEAAATNDHIYFLQGSLVYTIVETDAATGTEYYDLIVGGANGVLAPDYETYIDVLEGSTFDVDGQNILVRGGSIVGHRGDMGNAVKGGKSLPENSVESIVSAAQSGASSVEFDMYMTLDGELVLNHNASIAGYFDYPADYTGTRVDSGKKITERYWYGDLEHLVSTYNSEIPMQRLYQLYEAVDNEYPELRLHHEIKDSRTETLNRTIELMDEYGLRDRSDMMCFGKSTVAYTNAMGISSQYLSSVSKYTDSDRAYTMENQYRALNSTWHATWNDVTSGANNTEFLEEMKHFGQTAYPWATYSTTNGQWYEAGYEGFTTNAPHHTDDYIRELEIQFDENTGVATAIASTLADHAKGTDSTDTKSGEPPITLPDYLKDWWITKKYATGINEYNITEGLELIILEGAENVTVNGTTITRKNEQSGKAVIAVRYLQSWNGAAYYTYSRAVEITAPLYDHDHSFDVTWASNDTHHWHPCVGAGCMVSDPADLADVNGYAKHVFTDENDVSCDCGYIRTVSKVSDEYVTDGLILFLDANDNVATGTHDADSSVWVNLADIAQKITVPDGKAHSAVKGVWGEDSEHDAYYLDLDGYIKLPESVRQVIASGEFTIEFLMDGFAVNSEKTQNIMTLTGSDAWITANASTAPTAGTKNDNFVIYQNAWEKNVNFKVNSDGKPRAQISNAANVNDLTNSITFKVGSNANWYQDAALKSTSNDTYTAAPDVADWAGTTPQVLFGAAVDVVNSRAFDAQVKAIRIYDRVLSANEIAQNAEADQSSYYADPNAETGVPEGYETDGLVLFLDGINNTGKGTHSSYATEWVNLANPAETGTFLSGGSNTYTWTENGLEVNGGVILPASALAAVDGANFTVEFYVENYDATIDESVTRNFLVLIGPDGSVAGSSGGVWDDDFVSFQNSTKANPANDDLWCFDIKNDDHTKFGRISVTASSINAMTNAITFDKTKSVSWLQNGVAKSTQTGGASETWSTGIDLTNGTRLVFGAASGHMNNRSFYGDVKAIRIYNRTLTAEELAANAAADTLRYVGIDADALAQDSWENVVGNTGKLDKNITLDGIQAYADSQLANAAFVTVEVADANNGAYTFTYKLKATGAVIDTHTLYVDTEYTLDMSTLTAEEQAAVLNDMVEFAGSGTITTKWDDTAKAIYYKGSRNGNPVSHLYFPVYSSGEDYVFETEISFVSGGSDWSTMAFAAEGFVEHLQYAFWGTLGKTSTAAEFVRFQDPSANNGTFAVGHVNVPFSTVLEDMGDSWKETYTYDETNQKYTVTDTLKLKVVVYEGVMYGIINGTQVMAVVASGELAKDFNGVFGFNTANTGMNIHSISVRPITEENADEELAGMELTFNPIKAYEVDLYEPDTDVNTAPIVLQSATSEVTDVSSGAKRPSGIIFDVRLENGVLNACDGETKLGEFAALYETNHRKANVGARIALGDLATAKALAEWIVDNGAGNLWLISNDVEVLKTVTDAAGTVRGVVDFTGDSVRGPANIKFSFDTDNSGKIDAEVGGEYADKATRSYDWKTYTGGYESMDWADIYDLVFAEGYRTILLPESEITKDHVHFLQGSLVNVMVETDAATEAEFYDLIVTGVNGILSTSYAANIAALEGNVFDVNGEELVIRGGSIVGHRGDMGFATKSEPSLPENSVESIVSSAQSGASSVEFDMYMTLDGELVLNHNASIKGYFTYADDCPLSADKRISDDVGITQRYWYGDLEYMVSTYNPNIPLQRLYQLYEAVDTEYPELRLHHEIKDSRIETLNRTIELMDQYGLRGRSDMMCFNYGTVAYTNSMGISSQYLATPSSKTTDNRIYAAEMSYRPVNSTWHTTWGNIDTDYLEQLKHFGQTAYPWATYSNTYAGYYVQGYQGFTTDAPHHTDDIIRELIPAIDADGNVTVTARTLAYHEEGVFSGETPSGEKPITLPGYLQDYWVRKGYSDGRREYELTDFEIIEISGDLTINGANVTGEGLAAVRCKQTLTESDGGQYSFWIYSDTFEVGKVTEVTITGVSAAENLIYSGSSQTGYTGTPANANGYEGSYAVSYTGRGGTAYGPSSVAPTNAGDYTVTISVPTENAQYTGSTTLDFTIGKAELTITADNKSVTVGGGMPQRTYQVSGLKGSDVLITAPTLVCDADTAVAGTYPITASGADAGANYTITYVEGTLTVSEKPVPALTLTANKTTLSGGGTVTLTVGGLPEGGTVTVTCSGVTVTGSGGTWSASLPNRTAAYTFTAAYPGDDAYGPATAVCTVNVTRYTSSGSASSSGGSSSGNTTTEKNDDGSVTTTTTDKKTGEVTETTKTTNGITGTIVTDKKGNVTEVSATVPSAAVKEAEENGEAVTLPIEVEAASDADEAVGIEVNVPSKGATVEIPVENLTSGTVAVLVNADGTEEIIKTSVLSEDGVVVTLDGDATVKIVDNSKHFVDVHPVNHWAEDSIDFVTARELFNGKTANTFEPNATTTRGQLMTVLARLDGVDTSSAPIRKGMEWAVEHGISDGTNPGNAITRQQLAVMLWRYAGMPESDHDISHHTDANHISDYAETAMAWAIEHGILTGYADGSLKPHNPATRAHVATMMARFLNYIA